MDELMARWEEVDEREQKIESIRGARRTALRSARPPEASSLPAALQVAHVPSSAELRELATKAYPQPVTSLYLCLDPEREGPERGGSRPGHRTVFEAMHRTEVEARRAWVGRLPAHQQFTLRRDLREIVSLVRGLDPAGARCLVVLKSGQQLTRALRLPVRTMDSFSIDMDPSVGPLLAVVEAHAKTLAVEVTRERSRFWSEHLGHLEEIQSVEAFTPADRVAAAPERARQRFLTHLQWHLMTTAQLAGQLFAEQGFQHLILSGDRLELAELEPFLPDWLRSSVVARLHPPGLLQREGWRLQIEAVMTERRRAEEAAAVARLHEYEGSGLVRSGLVEVLEAVNRFLTRTLLVSVALRRPGHVCRQHHFLSLGEGTCPFCGAVLLAADNLGDALVEFARLHGVEVVVVEEAPELLAAYGGVAAVTYDMRPG
jgi:peptide chain release factor subunit 1